MIEIATTATPRIISKFAKDLKVSATPHRFIYMLGDNWHPYPASYKKILLVTGPSGGGKDSLINALPDRFIRWKTWTTRQYKREDEISDDPYIRVDGDTFTAEANMGNFIETSDYSGNRYGTHVSEAHNAFKSGKIPALRVNPEGAIFFKNLFLSREGIFQESILYHFYITPPSIEEIRERLNSRDKNQEVSSGRFSQAKKDLVSLRESQFVIINEHGKMKEIVDGISSIFSE